jgi:natural product biosynthesis luciferase-like monooxygenase protein
MTTDRPSLSVFFFSLADTGSGTGRYDLVLRTAALAEDLGFEAVWLPERHFHPFGGLFPNPAVVATAVAARTSRIAVRAGSVVAPLHHPARIAEDWAIVDAVSGGRAGVSLASGWNRRDFAVAHCAHEDRRDYLLSTVDQLRALWRGESVDFGDESLRTYPAPVRDTIPLWLTAMSGAGTFREAAARGTNVLTSYLQLDGARLAAHIGEYRATYRGSGAPHVTLMAHACVADTARDALRLVEKPLLTYQNQFLNLHERGHDNAVDGEPLTEEERHELARYAARKYATDRGLVGGPDEVAARLRDLAGIGVDEVACLVDFGLEPEVVADTLRRLAELRDSVGVG